MSDLEIPVQLIVGDYVRPIKTIGQFRCVADTDAQFVFLCKTSNGRKIVCENIVDGTVEAYEAAIHVRSGRFISIIFGPKDYPKFPQIS